MRAEEILADLRAVPFRPFRLLMNSGRTCEIRHPEMANVTRSTIYIFQADKSDVPAERVEMVSLLLIERVEHIETTSAA